MSRGFMSSNPETDLRKLLRLDDSCNVRARLHSMQDGPCGASHTLGVMLKATASTDKRSSLNRLPTVSALAKSTSNIRQIMA